MDEKKRSEMLKFASLEESRKRIDKRNEELNKEDKELNSIHYRLSSVRRFERDINFAANRGKYVDDQKDVLKNMKYDLLDSINDDLLSKLENIGKEDFLLENRTDVIGYIDTLEMLLDGYEMTREKSKYVLRLLEETLDILKRVEDDCYRAVMENKGPVFSARYIDQIGKVKNKIIKLTISK